MSDDWRAFRDECRVWHTNRKARNVEVFKDRITKWAANGASVQWITPDRCRVSFNDKVLDLFPKNKKYCRISGIQGQKWGSFDSFRWFDKFMDTQFGL